MVRGNWQRRVERTTSLRRTAQERRRSAANANNNQRRPRSTSFNTDRESMYHSLLEWIRMHSTVLMRGYDEIVLDVWTEVRPRSRREYLMDESDTVDGAANSNNQDKSRKKTRGGYNKKEKMHPNAKNREKASMTNESTKNIKDNSPSSGLCPHEFYHGREKCPGVALMKQQRRGRARSNSLGEEDVCSLRHYHSLPKPKNVASSSWVVNPKNAALVPPLTLAQVVHGKFVSHSMLNEENSTKPVALPVHVREALLREAFDSAPIKNLEGDADKAKVVMDMLYHSRMCIPSENDNDDNQYKVDDNDDESNQHSSSEENDDTDNVAIVQTLQQLLDEESLVPLNIIYITLQGVVIYDVHRGGLLHSHPIERYLLHGEAFDADFGKSLEDTVDSSTTFNNNSSNLHEELTHVILDEILSFLPDESTGVLPQVCQTWKEEVGTRSPQLWKMLLRRRNWTSSILLPNNNDYTMEESECLSFYRCEYISRYLAVRDVQSMWLGCHQLQNGRSNNNNPKDGMEYALQSFKATKGSPAWDDDHPNRGGCVVKVWPSKIPRALAAYSNDCTLRLFEAVRGSSSKMICRQTVCVRASPLSISKKKNQCELLAMDLDDSVVASLVTERHVWTAETVMDDDGIPNSGIIPWITVIPCEELICAGNEGILGEECIHSFDVRASIMDYIMGSNDEIAMLREEVYRYLSVVDSGTSDILISVTPQLVACGKGNFLFHASVSIPGYSLLSTLHADDDSQDSEAQMLAPTSIVFPSTEDRLFVISTQKGGAIIHSIRLMNGCDQLFASRPFRHQLHESEASVLCTNVVIHSGTTLKLQQLFLQRDGTFHAGSLEFQLPGNVEENVCVNVTPAHVLYETRGGGSIINLFEIDSRFDNNATNIFPPIQNASLCRVCFLQNDYILAILAHRSDTDDEEDEAFDGHWFGPGETSPIKARLYHIPSRQLLHECSMPDLYLSLDIKDEIIAINASKLGFIIAGNSAREVPRKAVEEELQRVNNDESLSSPQGKTSKGKKKRLAAKTAKKDKKDGFARGMSMRG